MPAGFYTGVRTILFNMVVNPVHGNVYVSNTEAFNHRRFEGPGLFAGHSLRGHLHESRITVLGTDGSVAPRHLNKHINYAVCCAPVPNAESETSLAQPNAMAITHDGATLYVAALGSSKIGVYNTQQLEQDTFVALLMARAEAGDCELVAKGTTRTGRSLGFLYTGNGQFQSDRQAVPPVPAGALRLLGTLPQHEITYTCVPPGSGRRIGIDRDADGVLDGDEDAAGSNPADPMSTPRH